MQCGSPEQNRMEVHSRQPSDYHYPLYTGGSSRYVHEIQKKIAQDAAPTLLFSKNVKSSHACYVRATPLLSSCCVGGVPTEFIVRAYAVRAASKRFPLRPRYVRADCDSLYLRLRHVGIMILQVNNFFIHTPEVRQVTPQTSHFDQHHAAKEEE